MDTPDSMLSKIHGPEPIGFCQNGSLTRSASEIPESRCFGMMKKSRFTNAYTMDGSMGVFKVNSTVWSSSAFTSTLSVEVSQPVSSVPAKYCMRIRRR